MKRLFLSILTLVSLSCEKPSFIEDGTSQSQQREDETVLKVVNGALAFETVEDFEATVKKIGGMSNNEYKNWQKEYSFKSLYLEYSKLTPGVSLQDVSKTRPELVFFNEKANAYELNSVNSNYAKITNEKGIVIINNSSYQFSATEIKCITGVDRESVNTLIYSVRDEYQANNIKFSIVEEGFKPRSNAKMGPWEKVQKGNGIYDMKDWNGAYYVKATLRCRYYYLPNPNPIFPGLDTPKMSIEMEGKYFREKTFGEEQRTPQQYSLSWAFELSDKLNFGTYFPYTGTFTESGIESISKVFYDGYPCDIRNLNIPVTAMDFNKSGVTVNSTTTFVITN